jgi:hypothetical protein
VCGFDEAGSRLACSVAIDVVARCTAAAHSRTPAVAECGVMSWRPPAACNAAPAIPVTVQANVHHLLSNTCMAVVGIPTCIHMHGDTAESKGTTFCRSAPVWQAHQRGTGWDCCQMAQSQAVAAPSCCAGLPAALQAQPRPAMGRNTSCHQSHTGDSGGAEEAKTTLSPHLSCCYDALQLVSVFSSPAINQVIHREHVPDSRIIACDAVL